MERELPDTTKKIDADGPGFDSELKATEKVAQIGKDIIVGTKEVNYVDDKNVISVIINAISVRINMPRGTVKALMACLAVLLLVVVMLVFKGGDSGSGTDAGAENETEAAEPDTSRKYPAEEGRAVNTERAANAADYVIISSHYRYNLPEGVLEILDSVYRISSESSAAPPDAEKIWQDQQQEEAMNSLVEDAMRDQYEYDTPPDPLF